MHEGVRSGQQVLKAEKHVQTADSSCALEYSGAGSGVEVKCLNRRAGAFGAGDLDPPRSRTMSDHGNLAGGKRHCAGIKIKSAVAAVGIVEVEAPRLLQKL